jgi:Mitochondrial carrier protein
MGVCLHPTEIKPKRRYRKYCHGTRFLASHIEERQNGLLTVTLDVSSTHHKLAARKIMAALYCWRVRYTLIYNSLDIVLIKSLPIFFLSFSRSVGGMCGAVVTSPFDVVKTRLQSDLFCTNTQASVPS